MNKMNWQWVFAICATFTFIFYLGYTNNMLLAMRHISLGMPDPYYFIALGLILLFAGWFMFVAVGQNTSTEIATNVGGISVHSQKPVAITHPLDYYKIPQNSRIDVARQIRDSWAYRDYMHPDKIDEICRQNNWDAGGPEIEEYLTNYKRAINSFKPYGYYPDGGIRFLGIHGLRWWIGGTAILVVNPEYLIPHGDGLVCVAAVKTYHAFEQIDKLPPEVMAGVYKHFKQYVPGKHTIIFGDQPHPLAVRAKVERNEDAKDDELHARPKYIWTLGLVEKPIDAKERASYLGDIESALLKEVGEMRNSQDWWQELERRRNEKPQQPEGGVPDVSH